MMDFTTAVAPYWYAAQEAERERVAQSRRWNFALSRLREADRRRERKQRHRVIVRKPVYLAGIHEL
jgi:hypothetical protein